MPKHTRQREETEEKKTPAVSMAQPKDTPRLDDTSDQFLTLQQTIGNRAVEQLIHDKTKQPANESTTLETKSVNYGDEGSGPIIMKGPENGGGGGDAVATKAPQAKK